MKTLKFIPLLILLISVSLPAYGQYNDVLGSWKTRLKKRIKGKPLQTLTGIITTLDSNQPLKPHSDGNQNVTGHTKGGGLYMVQLDNVNGDGNKTVQLIFTRLQVPLVNSSPVKVTGAYDDLGIFVCRKILLENTNSYAVNW